MRMIEFQEVGMKNYGPYRDPLVLEFENDSLILITGPNGVGKTMALDAIPFTLYGVTSKGARGDDVVNNVVGKNCKTWVKFRVDDTQYEVVRYHKYTRYGNTVILKMNGVDIKKGSKEVTPEIDRIICPRKTFMNTLMFGQKVKDFFTDLGDADKKDIFRLILNLEKWLTYYKKADEKLKEKNSELEEINKSFGIQSGLLDNAKSEIEILKKKKVDFEDDKQRQLSELKQDLQTNEILLKRWDEELEKLKSKGVDLMDLVKQISKVDAEYNDLESKKLAEIKELESKKQLKEVEITNKANEEKSKVTDEIREKVEKLRQEESERKDELTAIVQRSQEQRHQIELTIENLESQNVMYLDQSREIDEKVIRAEHKQCPLCTQDINESTLKHLVNTVDRLKSQMKNNHLTIEKMKEEIADLNKDLTNKSSILNGQREHLADQIKVLELDRTKQIKEIDLRIFEVRKKINKVFQESLEGINDKFQDQQWKFSSELSALKLKRKEATDIQLKVEEITESRKKVEDRISQINTRIDLKEKEEYDESQLSFYMKKEYEISSMLHNLDKLKNNVSKMINILSFWKTGYSSSGIPSMLIDDSIPFMNERVAFYLDKLTNGRYIVSFDTLAETKAGDFRDKISVNVLDTYTRANSRVQLSGGQTRIIDIATILTLGDLQSNIQHMKINILIFDEIFDSLDDENIGFVSKVLSKLKIGRSIYLISHRHEDQLEADEVLAMA